MGSGPLKYDWQRVSGDLAWLRVQVSRNTSLFMAANIKCKEKKIIDRIFKTALNRRDSHPALCTIYAHFHFVLCDAMRTRKIWEKENHIHTHTYTPHTYIHSNRDKGRVWAFPYNMKMPLNTYYGSLHPARVILQLEWAIRHSPFPFPFSYPFPPPPPGMDSRVWVRVNSETFHHYHFIWIFICSSMSGTQSLFISLSAGWLACFFCSVCFCYCYASVFCLCHSGKNRIPSRVKILALMMPARQYQFRKIQRLFWSQVANSSYCQSVIIYE